MSEVIETEELSKEVEKTNKFLNFIENIIAIIFWLYLIIKLFIYDIDYYLIKNFFPKAEWIIEYKFIILLSILFVLFFFAKKNYAVLLTLFIIFYPFVLLFYKIPFLIYKTKSWTIAIAFINTIISFFSGFKYNFFVFSITTISFFFLFKFDNPIILYSTIVVLIVTIIVVYFNRFLTIFTPSSMHKIHLNVVNFIIKHTVVMTTIDDEIKNLQVTEMNSTQLQKWTNNLQTTVILNRGCYFLSSRLQEYQKSNLNIIFYLLNLFTLLFLTIFFFSGMNYGLYKINHLSFSGSQTGSFFSFVYYSFNTIFFSSIPEIIPTTNYAHILKMLEIIFSFLLISIFTVLILNIKSKKHTDELEKIIQELTIQGQQVESRIKSEYRLSISDAIVEVERLKGGLIKFIYFLSENLNQK